MNEEASDARNATAAPTSCVVSCTAQNDIQAEGTDKVLCQVVGIQGLGIW